MKSRLAAFILLGPLLFLRVSAVPLMLDPENPHYFKFHGKPTIVITSGEHYGAVLNMDFDYRKYLDTLERDGLNGTRTWSGAYCEPSDAFTITSNTLAPAAGRLICPWARSEQPCYANGGNKFDLAKWDKAYFKRLRDFVSQAQKRNVIVELNLFCPFYEESMWRLSPMNARNNVNGVGDIARTNVYTVDKNGGLLAIQDAMVTRIVSELKGFDNLYYEICNEPYFGGVTLEWQRHIADTIRRVEGSSGRLHLISQNIANHKDEVRNPNPAVSLLNFHYATPPDTVALNYNLGKVVGDNETGFRGTNDSQYRMEGWDFIVAGGGLFNNLDYSFTVGHEDGTFVYPETQPGGGSPALRHQYGFLKQILQGFDFVHMHPDNDVAKADLPAGASIRALVKPGRDYLVYICTGLGDRKKGSESKTNFKEHEVTVRLDLLPGEYEAGWYDTRNCASLGKTRFKHSGGANELPAPAFEDDVALTVRRK